MSEREGRDIGLSTAIDAYVALGAPAPESPGTDGDVTDVLDPLDIGPLEWESLGAATSADEGESVTRDGDDAPGPGMAPSAS